MAERRDGELEETEGASARPDSAADAEGGDEGPESALEDEGKGRGARLEMALREAETIAQNLKESGTRR